MTTALSEAKAKAWEAVSKIDGWLTEAEAGELFDLAARATGPICEIGSWRGRSTAALALGSMAGNKQPVYAVDPHIGVPELDRPSASGQRPGWNSSSPAVLRANLDAAGINGLVKIVHKTSAEAVSEIPECAVVFIDGDHTREAVVRDLVNYMPKVRERGYMLMHDCAPTDPGVMEAVDEVVMPRHREWAPLKRVDSAVLFQRRTAQQSHSVMLAMPGPNLKWCAAAGILQSTNRLHGVQAENSRLGWDDMNRLWVRALNAAQKGECTHFAMLHSDIDPSPYWLDILLSEMDDRDADMVSTVVALKDHTGCTSCGIGDHENPWEPFRRFTMREVMGLPETFGIEDTPHPDRYLLHNTGCWVADLRKPIWRTVDADNCLLASLAFPIRARMLPSGEIAHERESEDWYFSRMIAQLGAKAYITRKVQTGHVGDSRFTNHEAWGTFTNGDEGTASKWREDSDA